MFSKHRRFSSIFSRSKSFFVKLFIQISSALLVFILLISIITINNIKEFSFKTINSSNQKILSTISYNYKYMNSFVSSLSLSIYDNNTTKLLMYSQKLDPLTLSQSMTTIYNNLYTQPFIKSIIIYSSTSSNFYYIGGQYAVVRSTEDMFDSEIKHILESITSKDTLTPIARKMPASPYELNNLKEVYTYILPNYDEATGKVTEAVVVNVDAKWILDNIISVNKINFGEKTETIITNEKGVVLGHSLPNMFMCDISNQEFYKTIMSNTNQSDSFISKVNGNKSVVTFSHLNTENLTFISITPYEITSSYIGKIVKTTLIFSIIFMFLSIGISFLLSKRFYHPIKNLRTNLYTLFGISEEKTALSDEFSDINNILKDIIYKVNELETFKDKSLSILKNDLLLKLLIDTSVSYESVAPQFTQYGIKVNINKEMILIIYNIDKYSDYYRPSNCDQNSYTIASIIKTIQEALSHNKLASETIISSISQFVSIINIEELSMDYDQLIIFLTSMIRKIQEEVYNNYSITISCSIGITIKNVNYIKSIYQHTLDQLQYRLIAGHSCIITSEIANELRSDSLVFPLKKARELVTALKCQKLEQVKEIHKNLTDYFTEYSIDNIRYGISYLSLTIFDAINMLENSSNIVFDVDVNSFNNKISSLETLNEINDAYFSLYTRIIDTLSPKRDTTLDELVEKIKLYINENYTERNLCLNSIADIFGYSPLYLGKIFKQATSFSISAYLNNVRLDHAARLLKMTSRPVDSILEEIGWESKKYFFTVFKKNFGTTPADFRLYK